MNDSSVSPRARPPRHPKEQNGRRLPAPSAQEVRLDAADVQGAAKHEDQEVQPGRTRYSGQSTATPPLPANYGLASMFVHSIGLGMGCLFDAKERTPREFRNLAEQAELDFFKI